MTQWEYRIEFIDLYVSHRDPKPEIMLMPAILECARLLFNQQHHHRRNSFGNRNPQT